ncbi:hypothetical protein [Merismopedia glauca]|nr:hypothetical protein [Merismopedia glauca]
MSKQNFTLLNYRHNVTSQTGEDGVLREIFRRLNISHGWFVEFGAWDGKHLSNTFSLLSSGWKGVEIEGDKARVQDLMLTAEEYPGQIIPIEAYVEIEGDRSLDLLLAKTPTPVDFDLLSIDIDSYDWQIWNSLKNYNPKVVLIEINGHIPPGIEHIHNHKMSSSSWTSTLKLGQSKGYSLVCFTANMMFVRNDYVQLLELPSDELENQDNMFLDKWIEIDFGTKFIPLGIQPFMVKLVFDLKKVSRKIKARLNFN